MHRHTHTHVTCNALKYTRVAIRLPFFGSNRGQFITNSLTVQLNAHLLIYLRMTNTNGKI